MDIGVSRLDGIHLKKNFSFWAVAPSFLPLVPHPRAKPNLPCAKWSLLNVRGDHLLPVNWGDSMQRNNLPKVSSSFKSTHHSFVHVSVRNGIPGVRLDCLVMSVIASAMMFCQVYHPSMLCPQVSSPSAFDWVRVHYRVVNMEMNLV